MLQHSTNGNNNTAWYEKYKPSNRETGRSKFHAYANQYINASLSELGNSGKYYL
jgi:hypothetical protein